LEGATGDATTVTAAKALLVDGCPGECEVSRLVEEVDIVLTSALVLLFGVVYNSR
jgi:hypothetical protein